MCSGEGGEGWVEKTRRGGTFCERSILRYRATGGSRFMLLFFLLFRFALRKFVVNSKKAYPQKTR